MSTKTQITPEEHKRQIEAYREQRPAYVAYAKALKRVLKASCAVSLPEAFVQARAKTIPSFAEKCARRFDKYQDAVNQFTDLCGARVIVQTLEHMDAVCQFVERNFTVVEREDKTTLLSTDKFGYRDLHYIIRVPAGCPLDFSAEERAAIRERTAELQVRTWVQHAWADTLHDRIYKAPLRLSEEVKRTGNLLAAVMEEGDRGFNRLANELDGMLANYTAHAAPEDVENEIGTQQVLEVNAEPEERPKLALKLARLIAAKGEWSRIVGLLEPHAGVSGPLQLELLSELGQALCRLHRTNPSSRPYQHGQALLQQVIAACDQPELAAVPNLRRLRSVHARALVRLGWSWETVEAEAHQARAAYRRAVEIEPTEPYYFADMIGFELRFAPQIDLAASLRSQILSALQTCRQHAVSGIELPMAYFTAGRLSLLAGQAQEALCYHARGIRHCLSGQGCVPCETLDTEIAWLHRAHFGKPLPEDFQWAKDLMLLAKSPGVCPKLPGLPPPASSPFKAPVLVVAGGAGSLLPAQLPQVQALVDEGLAPFRGTVLSGGTTSGVPGCVGAAAKNLADRAAKGFHLCGYIPKALPHDAEKDTRYDQLIPCGTKDFSPAQVLQGWKDVVAAGIKPSEVTLFGFGGGKISAFEYRLALALGATVGVVSGSGGAADALLKDPLWPFEPKLRLFPLPADPKTVRAFVVPDGCEFEPQVLETMAQEFHTRYRNSNLKKIKPDNLKMWEHLPPTLKEANREQAAYAVHILEAAGFEVHAVKGTPVIFTEFSPKEIELMAMLEHGRWNVERLRSGYRPGKVRDDDKKIHNCIVAWDDKEVLTEEIKDYDRAAVGAFPEILAKAGLEVFRE